MIGFRPSYNDNPQVERKRYWRNQKIQKYSQKNVRIVYNSLGVGGLDFICLLLCVAV